MIGTYLEDEKPRFDGIFLFLLGEYTSFFRFLVYSNTYYIKIKFKNIINK